MNVLYIERERGREREREREGGRKERRKDGWMENKIEIFVFVFFSFCMG